MAYIPGPVGLASYAVSPVLISSTSVASTTIGRTTLIPVILGQDSTPIPRKKGLSWEYFYKGEPISAVRSDGRRTIGEVISVSQEGITLALGGGVEKRIPAAEIPQLVSKLVGPYYFGC